MTQHDSPRPPEGGSEPSPDPLEALSERVRHAQDTAARLVREANEAAQRATEGGASEDSARRPPPRGYAVPGEEGGGSSALDLQALVALLDLGRTLVPPELREQISELVREILMLVRAIVDWYLERIDQRRKTPVEVEDIPIS
jgi:hypothetical protein